MTRNKAMAGFGHDDVCPDDNYKALVEAQLLRQRAETRKLDAVVQWPENEEILSPEAVRGVVHELRVHQIELEMQNEELREAQRALQVAKELYVKLYDFAPVGYCTLNSDGQILRANFAAASLFDETRSALSRHALHRYVHKADQDTYYLWRKALQGSGLPHVCELRVVNSSAIERWVQLSGSIDASTQQIQLILTDISVRKRTEQELIATRDEAQQANAAKSEFLSSMSHEFRTPLNAVIGFAQVLGISKSLSAENKERASHIERAGRHLLALVIDLLDLSKIERHLVEFSLESVSVTEVLESSLQLVKMLTEKDRISLLNEVDPALFVCADFSRLCQVITNLLSNAIKYNHQGGTVRISCNGDDGFVRIQIIDSGCGIAAEKQHRVFTAFDRLGRESHGIEGNGIGLTISKRIIEDMGGRIGFDSVEGCGSTFWVELPRSLPPPQVDTEHEAIARTADQAKISRRVVYIEDNQMSLYLMRSIFALRDDYQLFDALYAGAGITLVQTESPALVFMDINLPDIDGYAALKLLKADPRTAHIPVYAISADALLGDVTRGKAAGFDGYITKPINVLEIMSLLDNLP